MSSVSSGRIGEDMACRYLVSKGYRIIKRTFRAAGGEIDIIASHGNRLAFVEVKARRNNDFGSPAEAVGYHKQQKIIRTASAFLMHCDICDEIGFDVCEVYTATGRINYIENAFESE